MVVRATIDPFRARCAPVVPPAPLDDAADNPERIRTDPRQTALLLWRTDFPLS
jgi:hypothetical protein